MEWFEELIKGKWTEKFAKAIEEKGYKIANKQDNWRRSTINIVLPDDSCQSLYLDCSIAKSDVSIWIRKGWLKEEDIKELVMLADILKMTIKEEMETNPKLKLLYVTGMINLEEKTLFSQRGVWEDVEWNQIIINGNWSKKVSELLETSPFKVIKQIHSQFHYVFELAIGYKLYMLRLDISEKDKKIIITAYPMKREKVNVFMEIANKIVVFIKEELESDPRLRLLYITGEIKLQEEINEK